MSQGRLFGELFLELAWGALDGGLGGARPPGQACSEQCRMEMVAMQLEQLRGKLCRECSRQLRMLSNKRPSRPLTKQLSKLLAPCWPTTSECLSRLQRRCRR